MFKKFFFKKKIVYYIKLYTLFFFFLKFNFLFLFKKFKKKIIFFINSKKEKIFFIFNIKKKIKIKKKKSKIGKIKEMRFNLNIYHRDYFIKIKKVNNFLLEGYTVKVVVVFRGREVIFKEKGVELLLKFQNNIKGVYFKFSDIEFEGKYIYSIFIPKIKNENKKKNYKFNKKKNNN